MKLDILIPSLESREKSLNRLVNQITKQTNGLAIDICYLIDNGEKSIGEKRNALLQQSIADYVCFIDDDDRISDNYIQHLMAGIDKGVDCCSLQGLITVDGNNPKRFQHSLRHSRYAEVDGLYIRYPNHLNCIKADIAKRFVFQNSNFGEDTEWATQIHKAGALKTEHWIDDVIYYYDYITNK